jgi:hypothetical protein
MMINDLTLGAIFKNLKCVKNSNHYVSINLSNLGEIVMKDGLVMPEDISEDIPQNTSLEIFNKNYQTEDTFVNPEANYYNKAALIAYLNLAKELKTKFDENMEKWDLKGDIYLPVKSDRVFSCCQTWTPEKQQGLKKTYSNILMKEDTATQFNVPISTIGKGRRKSVEICNGYKL